MFFLVCVIDGDVSFHEMSREVFVVDREYVVLK